MWAYLRPWEAVLGVQKVTFNGAGVCDLTGLGFQFSSHPSAMQAVIHIWSITQISSPCLLTCSPVTISRLMAACWRCPQLPFLWWRQRGSVMHMSKGGVTSLSDWLLTNYSNYGRTTKMCQGILKSPKS